VTHDDVRAIALALPEAVEQDHHGRPSFRVDGKIFATLWSPTHMNVMLDEHGILAAAEEAPDSCAPLYWGKRLAAVQVELAKATAPLAADLLQEAWSLNAPRRLLP
jgi:hypothetical protein